MNPVRTKNTNMIFKGKDCEDLPGSCFYLEGGETPSIETVWELDEEEVRQVMESGRIYLNVIGLRIQPVMLTTESVRDAVQKSEVVQ